MLRRLFARNHAELPYLPSKKIYTDCIPGLISVVLPVYNGGEYIAEAIESVQAQTINKWELIIVDDGSEDDSAEIAENYAKNDGRIRIIRQTNQKLPKALNNGFKVAKGEFYTWVSADNRMLPDCLFVMAEELKSCCDADMVYGNMYLIDRKGTRIKGHGWFELPINSGNVILPSSTRLLNTVANNTIGAAFMYRAGAEAVLGGYSPRMFLLEDYDYFMRMNSLFHIRHVSEKQPIYAYRFHEGSLTSRDAELGITASRPRLMSFDAKRREFYKKPMYFSAEEKLPFQERIFNRAGLYKADKACGGFCLDGYGGAEPNGFCSDNYSIIKDGGRFFVYKGREPLCRLSSATDAAKFLRLRAVCDFLRYEEEKEFSESISIK